MVCEQTLVSRLLLKIGEVPVSRCGEQRVLIVHGVKQLDQPFKELP